MHAHVCGRRLQDLNTKEIEDGFEQVVAKPETAISVQAWEQQAVRLLERTKAAVDKAKRLRKAMKDTMEYCDDVVKQHQATLARSFAKAQARGEQAVATNDEIIAETRAEIVVVDAEIFKLFDAIAEQEVPLKYAAARLKERASRPDEERTLDIAHKALIEEVAELEAAVRFVDISARPPAAPPPRPPSPAAAIPPRRLALTSGAPSRAGRRAGGRAGLVPPGFGFRAGRAFELLVLDGHGSAEHTCMHAYRPWH